MELAGGMGRAGSVAVAAPRAGAFGDVGGRWRGGQQGSAAVPSEAEEAGDMREEDEDVVVGRPLMGHCLQVMIPQTK